jgi:hypothetical protein
VVKTSTIKDFRAQTKGIEGRQDAEPCEKQRQASAGLQKLEQWIEQSREYLL